ncbi:uncharacterized protein MELLADRAFT_108839 [Melampsora larici-populina 98AG31]|uniref:Uncharacterized protein n=1 Tax=Melampsora larici-populina (strain 98AG31 / pathotype 3-4-7) TaxID=747676 RepID=F4RUF6_MELLP|nr:uncharacterized protein MELLADRAFT_108839 [Melampsora larici-populina 98AG31]EGG04007.1 hypothetical protein MELLADRAFT_108839 [Melampsora larici-populina 98AG31]
MTAMVYPLRRTVTSLFFEKIPDHIPMQLGDVVLPKLRVIRSIHIAAKPWRPIWFQWSIFKTVEVFISNYSEAKGYWEEALKHLEKFKKAPKLKHFIFITHDIKIKNDTILVELFKAHGITCHFRTRMTHIDVLNFVDQLDQEFEEITTIEHKFGSGA